MNERKIDFHDLDDGTLEQLLWEDAGGTLSPEEHERLQAHLDAYPEARARADEIAALHAHLDAVPEEEPPAELRQRIRAALPASGTT